MYKLRLRRQEKRKLLRAKWLIIFLAVLVAGLIVWLAWIRPMQNESNFRSFEECAAAGNPVQQTYPEVCLTKDGKRFVNPKQDAAHQASLDGEEELVPPSNPALLNLDITEWGARIPLTVNTFDLVYTYIEHGGSEFLLFTYKRLIRLGTCKGDIGMKLTRSALKREPPFTENNPAPVASLDKSYFYAVYAEKPCHDPANAEQAELVKQIAGDKTLTQTTTSLVTKLVATPKE